MKETIYWTTKDGKKIDIDEMSVEHLINVLKMIVRQNNDINNQCPHNIEQAMDMELYAEDFLWKP